MASRYDWAGAIYPLHKIKVDARGAEVNDHGLGLVEPEDDLSDSSLYSKVSQEGDLNAKRAL